MNLEYMNIVVLGESGSGKTTLIRTFMEHAMPPEVRGRNSKIHPLPATDPRPRGGAGRAA